MAQTNGSELQELLSQGTVMHEGNGVETVSEGEAQAALRIERLPSSLHPQTPLHPQGVLHHRVREIAWHIPWYGFRTQARLASDSGVTPSTISRLLRGRELPSLPLALRLTGALSRRLNRPLDLHAVFSLDGLYSDSVCSLCACRSCLPPTAYDPEDNHLNDAPDMEAGQWVRAQEVGTQQLKNAR